MDLFLAFLFLLQLELAGEDFFVWGEAVGEVVFFVEVLLGRWGLVDAIDSNQQGWALQFHPKVTRSRHER